MLNNSFENTLSPVQNLSFQDIDQDVLCYQAIESNFQLIKAEEGFTNLGLLLSDQCPFQILTAKFKGTDRLKCLERRVFAGSIIRQLNEVMGYLRKDEVYERPDYPVAAIKEVMLNCICHRDYRIAGNTQIAIFQDRIEFITLGSLFDSMDLEAIKLGVAHSRNPNLASLLYCMNLMDNYGTGIEKINKAYKSSQFEPSFKAAQGLFKVSLPNFNHGIQQKKRKAFFMSEPDQILSFAKDQGFVTRKEVEELLESGSTKSFKILKQLCDQKLLIQTGKGKNSVYLPITSD